MCHSSCLDFARRQLHKDEVQGKSVLEVGSMDVNGSIRPIVEGLAPSSYIGVDVTPGPGVDIVCNVGNLTMHFGQSAFDILVCTEVLEHVRDWRNAVSNIKNVLKPGGLLVLTTRSKGFGYHGFPHDFWRYEIDDIRAIFADMTIEILDSDPFAPGIFLKARKPDFFQEQSLQSHTLYSIVAQKRCRTISAASVLCLQLVELPIRALAASMLPVKLKAALKSIGLARPRT